MSIKTYVYDIKTLQAKKDVIFKDEEISFYCIRTAYVNSINVGSYTFGYSKNDEFEINTDNMTGISYLRLIEIFLYPRH